MLCGPLPTPGIAFITSSMRADAGVVISASHNPFEDNGIKIFAADGFKLPDEVEARDRGADGVGRARRAIAPHGAEIGKATKIEDSRGRYVVFLKSAFPRQLTLDGLHDRRRLRQRRRLQGRAGGVRGARRRGHRASARKPDGTNINDDCGALHPQKMCEAVQAARRAHRHRARRRRRSRHHLRRARRRGRRRHRHGAVRAPHARARRAQAEDAGHDGDVEHRPRALAARSSADGSCARRSAIATSSRRCGSNGYNFGGEQSGHLVFLDHMTTGDGIVARAAGAGDDAASGKPLSELRARDDALSAGAGQPAGQGEEAARRAADGDGARSPRSRSSSAATAACSCATRAPRPRRA